MGIDEAAVVGVLHRLVSRAGITTVAAALLVSLASSGCHHPTEGGVRMQQVIAAFDKAGWKASELRSTDPGRMSAQKCVEGTLAGVEAIICARQRPHGPRAR